MPQRVTIHLFLIDIHILNDLESVVNNILPSNFNFIDSEYSLTPTPTIPPADQLPHPQPPDS